MTTATARLTSIEDVAEILGVTPRWLADECRAGRVDHIRLGRRRQFTPEQIQALIDGHRVAPDTRPSPATSTPGDGWARTPRQARNARRRRPPKEGQQ